MVKLASAPIFEDLNYIHCISLAMQCKNDKRRDENYGVLLIRDGRIIGQGFNRAVVHPRFRLERAIRQGYANHAEIEALNQAVMAGESVDNSEIYVAGYFFSSGQLFFQDAYTCRLCPFQLGRFEVKTIFIPSPEGWISKNLEEALREGRTFFGDSNHLRKKSVIGKYNLAQIQEQLLRKEDLAPLWN